MTSEFPDDPRFTLARSVVLEAGDLALRYFSERGSLAVEVKMSGQDVASVADRAVESLIRSRLAEAFPEDGFLGEESGGVEGTSGHVWIVDPIDGTSCFLHGIANWCVSIALAKGTEPVLGLIYQPVSGELFVAARGRGAFLDGAPMRVDGEVAIGNGLLGVGTNSRLSPKLAASFIHVLLDAGGMFFRNGSGALTLAYVACGRLAGYYEPHIHAWDCMAGLCLIREAGGWTADYPAGRLADGGPIIVSPPQIRDDLLKLVAEAAEAAGAR